jgi:hypothetical protein
MKAIRISMVVILLFLGHLWGIAQEPPAGGAIRLKAGGYVYAEDDGCFDVGPNGITIEAWIWIDEPPGDNETQVVIAKPGSYAILLRGRDPFSPMDQRLPSGATRAMFYTWIAPQRRGGSGTLLMSGQSPVGRWIHIAFQIKDNLSFKFVDGSSGGMTTSDAPVFENDQPLFIGGVKPVKLGLMFWGSEEWTFKGMIDEVRISRGFRYPAQVKTVKIDPERRFKDDVHTIALWHFNRALEKGRYPDPHGHTLIGVKSSIVLGESVQPRDKLTTFWGKVKAENLP